MKKTITLCDESENPGIVICPGHVSAKEFNAAFRREWKSSDGGYSQDSLRYEYWKAGKVKWKKSVPGKKGVKAVTITSWD